MTSVYGASEKDFRVVTVHDAMAQTREQKMDNIGFDIV
ncbi:hypothetical protein JOD18_001085 [Gracilibacillus alcaliphilus]|nr:hypothetical protein [Gracilibacillus alcaliphilus]